MSNQFLSKLLIGVFALLTSVTAFSSDKDAKIDLQAKLEKVQGEVDRLMGRGGEYAYIQISNKGGLNPFAIGVTPNGSVMMFEPAKEQKTEISLADKVLELRRLLEIAASKDKIDAAALFVGASVPLSGTNADQPGLAIEMEHRQGISMLRFSPYELDTEKKTLKFDRPIEKIKPVVFFKAEKDKLENKNNKEEN